jgi:hypothetical protein
MNDFPRPQSVGIALARMAWFFFNHRVHRKHRYWGLGRKFLRSQRALRLVQRKKGQLILLIHAEYFFSFAA